MKSADLFRELERAGWILDRVRGSHHVFIHPTKPAHVRSPRRSRCRRHVFIHRAKPGHVSVPHPRKVPGKGPVRKLRRQAGLA